MTSSHSAPVDPRADFDATPETGVPVSDVTRVERLAEARRAIMQALGQRIVGQHEVIDLLLTCLFAGGHALFVGVPGLAKTLLIQSLAEVLSLDFQRIQFTPDLMPSDIVGTEILEEDPETGRRRFRFARGPIFTQILLADEINRTPPKTQAALLQAMAERRVTAAGRTLPLGDPYFVFATQNPIEQEGTYPLPEAQLDRFLFEIKVDYPSAIEEAEIVARTTSPSTAAPEPVISTEELRELLALVPRMPAAPHVVAHAVALARATRPASPEAPSIVRRYVDFGAGPRASQGLILGGKARAALRGRFAVEVEDVRALAPAILRHRIVPNFRAGADGVTADEVVRGVLASVTVDP